MLSLLLVFLLLLYMLMNRTGEHNGQTWGKQALGIRVVREDQQPVSFWFAFFREALVKNLLFGYVGGYIIIPLILNYIWPLWDKKNQAIHDKLVRSLVVKE